MQVLQKTSKRCKQISPDIKAIVPEARFILVLLNTEYNDEGYDLVSTTIHFIDGYGHIVTPSSPANLPYSVFSMGSPMSEDARKLMTAVEVEVGRMLDDLFYQEEYFKTYPPFVFLPIFDV